MLKTLSTNGNKSDTFKNFLEALTKWCQTWCHSSLLESDEYNFSDLQADENNGRSSPQHKLPEFTTDVSQGRTGQVERVRLRMTNPLHIEVVFENEPIGC